MASVVRGTSTTSAAPRQNVFQRAGRAVRGATQNLINRVRGR